MVSCSIAARAILDRRGGEEVPGGDMEPTDNGDSITRTARVRFAATSIPQLVLCRNSASGSEASDLHFSNRARASKQSPVVAARASHMARRERPQALKKELTLFPRLENCGLLTHRCTLLQR